MLDLWNSYKGGRREHTPLSCPLASTCAPLQSYFLCFLLSTENYNKNWKNSCSGYIQGKKQWTCQFYSKCLLAWRSYRLQCGGLIGFNVEKRECYSRETSLTVRGCTPSTPVQGLEERQRDGLKQSSILSASVGI